MDLYNSFISKIYNKVFKDNISSEMVLLIDVFTSKRSRTFECLSFIVNQKLIILTRIFEDESINGRMVDFMMSYADDIAAALRHRVLHDDSLQFESAQAFLLVPETPYKSARKRETYEPFRFSTIRGPSLKELKENRVDKHYTVLDLQLNPKIDILFNKTIQSLK